MGIRVECDWCRQAIAAGEPYVTIEIDGKVRRGAKGNEPTDVSGPARVYCGADRYTDDDPAAHGVAYQGEMQWGHRESCAARVLSLLDGNPIGRADAGMEWRLVSIGPPTSERLVDAPVDVLDVSPRTLAALKNGGIKNVRELARMTEAQWYGIKGIARGGAGEILSALHKHEKASPKTVAGKLAAMATASS